MAELQQSQRKNVRRVAGRIPGRQLSLGAVAVQGFLRDFAVHKGLRNISVPIPEGQTEHFLGHAEYDLLAAAVAHGDE